MKWNCNRIYGLLLMLVVCLSACNDDDADRTMKLYRKAMSHSGIVSRRVER